VSPTPVVLGAPVDIAVFVEGVRLSREVEICVAVGWPFEIEGRAMLCKAVPGSSSLSVAFRSRLTAKAIATRCQITVLADAADDQGAKASEIVDVIGAL